MEISNIIFKIMSHLKPHLTKNEYKNIDESLRTNDEFIESLYSCYNDSLRTNVVVVPNFVINILNNIGKVDNICFKTIVKIIIVAIINVRI